MFQVNYHQNNPNERVQRDISNDRSVSSAMRDLVFQFVNSLSDGDW